MTELLEWSALRPVNGVNALILIVLIWILYRVIQDEGNLILWADFISTRGADSKQHGDLTKVGQLVGIGLAAISVLMYADNEVVEPVGLSALLGVALLYLGGVTMYAANLRSKQGSVTTTIEPAPVPVPVKTTTVETPPIAANKGESP